MTLSCIAFLAVTLLLTASAQIYNLPSSEVSCPSGYEIKGQSCLRIVTKKLNWTEAQKNCSSDGGYLVNIMSQRDQADVHSVLKKIRSKYLFPCFLYKVLLISIHSYLFMLKLSTENYFRRK